MLIFSHKSLMAGKSALICANAVYSASVTNLLWSAADGKAFSSSKTAFTRAMVSLVLSLVAT